MVDSNVVDKYIIRLLDFCCPSNVTYIIIFESKVSAL